MSVLKTAPIGADIFASWTNTGVTSAAEPAGAARIGGLGDVYAALSRAALHGDDILACQEVGKFDTPIALRLDEVAFPVGAIAHRHTHSGAGWRYLVSGALRIETDHSAEVMETGMSWFEPADNPVRAVALQTEGVARFVRFMVIPQAFIGRSTFCLCDPKDADLPRLQVTHRHFDHAL